MKIHFQNEINKITTEIVGVWHALEIYIKATGHRWKLFTLWYLPKNGVSWTQNQPVQMVFSVVCFYRVAFDGSFRVDSVLFVLHPEHRHNQP